LQKYHWTVPFGRNKDFVGRKSILKDLLEKIMPDSNKNDCQRTAVEGLGGVGKTQIALEAAFQIRDNRQDCSIFWVSAVDATSFANGYRDIGRRLGIDGIDEAKADVNLLVKAALDSENVGNWLLIIDNADDVGLLFDGANTKSITECLPFNLKGSILFTTGNNSTAVKLDIPQTNIITIPEMSSEEATDLLRTNLKESQINESNTTELLSFLDNLPLAIKTASAYMAMTGISTTEYLEFCRKSDEETIYLLSQDFEDRHRYKTTKNPIAAAWLISFDYISQNNPLAADYLGFLCFLAPKDIPRSLLPSPDGRETAEAIGMLEGYKFITVRKDLGFFDIHQLIQLTVRSWLKKNERQEKCVTSVIQRLVMVFPTPQYQNRDMWIKYLPHAQMALKYRTLSTNQKAASQLLYSVGASHSKLGNYDDAERMYLQALEGFTAVLGRDNELTLDSMNGIALVLGDKGEYEKAEQMHRQTLKLRETSLGNTHASTLNSMANLASVLGFEEKYEEAKQMHQRALALKEEIHGKMDPSTLASMSGLGQVLYGLKEYQEAEKIHRETLRLRQLLLGDKDPSTLNSIAHLAQVLKSQGRDEEAIESMRKCFQLRFEVLGPHHPKTVSSLSVLNEWGSVSI
jgi:tetratricopeptide (TPR) repeat protein